MTTEQSEPTISSSRIRYWPAVVLIFGIVFGILAIVLGGYVDGRIVLLGSVDAVGVVALLGITAVWCLAGALIGCILKVTRGRFAEVLGAFVSFAVALGAIGLSAVVGFVSTFGLSVDPRYKLDVPGSTSKYIVSTFTFGETSVTLYRGDGTVYTPVGQSMPFVNRSKSFKDTHRVETDASGKSFLVYLQGNGEDARIPLP